MPGFTKLSSSIIFSTVWREPNHVRICWVTALAMADARGVVEASIPGFADAARVTLPECEDALQRFQAPDPYSRSKENEGRRIELIDGGFRLLNYETYRNGRDPEARREQNREAQARHRSRLRQPTVSQGKPTVSQGKPASAQAEAEAEAEDLERETLPSVAAPASPSLTPKTLESKAAKKPKASKWTFAPEAWEPNKAHVDLANSRGICLETELLKFRAHEFSSPKTDANRAFTAWLLRASGMSGARKTNGHARGPVQHHGVDVFAGVTEIK